MVKAIWLGVAAAALLSSSSAAAPPRAETPAWVVVPGTRDCRTEIELTAASGAAAPAAFVSDGDGVDLVFAKADAPEQAFLPIRIDRKPYSNLVLRQADGRSAAIRLSAESLAALRKGGALQIGWLAQEPVEVSLAGSDQGLADLRTCGAQVAERFRARETARREAAVRADAETRAKAISDEQLATAKAQTAAAEAERARAAAEAERLRAEAETTRERAQEQARAEAYPYAGREEREYPRDRYQADPYADRYEPYPYRRW